MTEKQLRTLMMEEEDCTFGSIQMIRFGHGVFYAMHGFEIPPDLYPLPTSKYLGKYYANSNAPIWMVRLWASNAMIQMHQTALDMFETHFDLWFPEKKLHAQTENFCSVAFVTQGVTWGEPTRCTQCGKLMEVNTICAPCWLIYAPQMGLTREDLKKWSKERGLKICFKSIWAGFKQ
jgi:hypothetical protein